MSYGVWKKHKKNEGWSSIEIDTPPMGETAQGKGLQSRIVKYEKNLSRIKSSGHRMPVQSIEDRNLDELKWDMYQRETYPNRFHDSYSFGGGEHRTWFSYDNVLGLMHALDAHSYDGTEEKEVFHQTMRRNHFNHQLGSFNKDHELLRVDVNDIDGRYYITAQCVNAIHQFDISSDPHITSDDRLYAHVRAAEENVISKWFRGPELNETLEDRCTPRMLSKDQVRSLLHKILEGVKNLK